MKVPRSSIYRVVEACLEVGARAAEIYLSPNMVVRSARRFKPKKRDGRTEIVVTIGVPNYKQRDFIKACKKAGEPFPIKKMQMKWWPEK